MEQWQRNYHETSKFPTPTCLEPTWPLPSSSWKLSINSMIIANEGNFTSMSCLNYTRWILIKSAVNFYCACERSLMDVSVFRSSKAHNAWWGQIYTIKCKCIYLVLPELLCWNFAEIFQKLTPLKISAYIARKTKSNGTSPVFGKLATIGNTW